MWRYRELMPLFDGEEPVTLGEGFTPLVHARRLGATIGLDRLFVKDESLNPTNSFKARGQSAAVTRAKYLGADDAVGSVGRQRRQRAGRVRRRRGTARPRSSCRSDVKPPFERECVLYGADVTLVDGLITDAGRIAAERGGAAWLVRRLDAEGAVSHRGKEDDGLRARRAARVVVARLDHLSHRRRHRHGRHVEGVRRAGAHRLDAENEAARGWCPCRPTAVRRSFARFSRARRRPRCGNTRRPSRTACACPSAIGDFLILRAIRESGGTALRGVRPSDGRRDDRDRQREGISAAPEGGAALAAIKRPR